jgi:pSer/pThr/pTyr-binding forkhead associated (FHA) protein
LPLSGGAKSTLRLGAMSGPHAGRVITVPARLTVGRSAGCELRLDDPKVSRQHATLLAEGGGLSVRDDGSLNGTWLNDRRIDGLATLRIGDRVRIGGSEFLVTDGGQLADPWLDDSDAITPPVGLETVLVGNGTAEPTTRHHRADP